MIAIQNCSHVQLSHTLYFICFPSPTNPTPFLLFHCSCLFGPACPCLLTFPCLPCLPCLLPSLPSTSCLTLVNRSLRPGHHYSVPKCNNLQAKTLMSASGQLKRPLPAPYDTHSYHGKFRRQPSPLPLLRSLPKSLPPPPPVFTRRVAHCKACSLLVSPSLVWPRTGGTHIPPVSGPGMSLGCIAGKRVWGIDVHELISKIYPWTEII